MWDVIVSVPDHCLSFYFTVSCGKALAAVYKDTLPIYLRILYFPYPHPHTHPRIWIPSLKRSYQIDRPFTLVDLAFHFWDFRKQCRTQRRIRVFSACVQEFLFEIE